MTRLSPRQTEALVILAGIIVVIVFIATFDWRVAGVVAGIALALSAIDLTAFRRR